MLKTGAEITSFIGYTRSSQVRQAISAIGYHLIDKKKADYETGVVYRGVWKVKISLKCEYCGRGFQEPLLMGSRDHCNRSRCILGSMRAHC